jgi:hypothetical protein
MEKPRQIWRGFGQGDDPVGLMPSMSLKDYQPYKEAVRLGGWRSRFSDPWWSERVYRVENINCGWNWRVRRKDGATYAFTGDWLIRTADDDLIVMDQEDFEDLLAKAKPGERA